MNLGVWNKWINFNNDSSKYHTMLYNEGQMCYNSYKRMTYVRKNVQNNLT